MHFYLVSFSKKLYERSQTAVDHTGRTAQRKFQEFIATAPAFPHAKLLFCLTQPCPAASETPHPPPCTCACLTSHASARHTHSVSTTTMHERRAGKARDQRVRMRAASGHANTRAFGQSMGARRGNATPAPIGASLVMLFAESSQRGHQCQPANAAHTP